jgi:intracellular sulfur oxidation DsrE/DsrF family protein
MTPKRYKDRVTAEITLFHLMQMASERDWSVSREQAMAFLNQERAQEMWLHMMQAGLDFIACRQKSVQYPHLARTNCRQ